MQDRTLFVGRAVCIHTIPMLQTSGCTRVGIQDKALLHGHDVCINVIRMFETCVCIGIGIQGRTPFVGRAV